MLEMKHDIICDTQSPEMGFYKEDIPNQDMIVTELKRCSDEIASTDLNFQAIWDMIEISQENDDLDF